MNKFSRLLFYGFQATLWLAGFIVILIFLFIGFLGIYSKVSQKKSVFAGYASGSLVDKTLEVHEDSTYYLSSSYLEGRKYWRRVNDTLILYNDNCICAKIVDVQLIDYYCDGYRSLPLMVFRHFDPAKKVDFPKN